MVVKIDTRNVQKTGNMHYVYLPTLWCKKYNIDSDSKVSTKINSDGTLMISPQIEEKELAEINLATDETTPEIITKLVIACYVNPTKSFNIKLGKGTDVTKLVDKGNVVSVLEFVEFDENNITYESTGTVGDPDILLKTMVKKIKHLLDVMVTDYNRELIDKYEDEIDRSRLLIEKSVISVLTFSQQSKTSIIDLHYISSISRDLERMVDSVIMVDRDENLFLKKILKIIEDISNLLENPENLNYSSVIELDKSIVAIKSPEIANIKAYGKRRIKRNLTSIVEVFFDWALTKLIDKKGNQNE